MTITTLLIWAIPLLIIIWIFFFGGKNKKKGETCGAICETCGGVCRVLVRHDQNKNKHNCKCPTSSGHRKFRHVN